MSFKDFSKRHIGITEDSLAAMLEQMAANSVDNLIQQTIPKSIRLKDKMALPSPMNESQYLQHIEKVGSNNKVFRTYIGLGYYNSFTPSVVRRNIFENPGWYTAYTPYQAEISQGRLEALLNFQTMVTDLTGMELANASLLDEATAAAEAMLMFFNTRSREQKNNGASKIFVSDKCYPQTLEVLTTRAKPLGIELVINDVNTFSPDKSFFACLFQYPNVDGNIIDHRALVDVCKESDVKVAVASDMLSLTLLTPPGEWGADVVFGTTQRFGIPLGYGGPHAAYFATKEMYKRNLPGRIIGVTIDANGNKALRMALQTREQHIKREKATSNICTAQVLLAVMAGMYAVYHGPEGLKKIAARIHRNTAKLNDALLNLKYTLENKYFFDTLLIKLSTDEEAKKIKVLAESKGINFYYQNNRVGISIDETTTQEDVDDIIGIFAVFRDVSPEIRYQDVSYLPETLTRISPFLLHETFNSFHSETEMMRYIKRLENKDISLTHAMIPLGSCTMKLNAATELLPLTYPEFASIHPFVPLNQVEGYQYVINELEKYLCAITGFHAVSLQPNSGAQGEFAGLLVIRKYFESRGASQRNIALIPASAHGTNPASAVMAGFDVVVVKCDEQGNINMTDLEEKVEKYKDKLGVLMVTYPSTHGVFEENIVDVTVLIHQNGGQVYMDGANMNAQVGLTNPSIIGADVCHLNLHKTFAIPHGGGGPGMGPIGVAEHLAPYLPIHSVIETGGKKGCTAVSAAPWGSALILLISYAYVRMLGSEGLTKCSEYAILNANYIKSRLEKFYDILYQGTNNRVAHELIIDCRGFKKVANIEVSDIAKRLMDYGFHAPTVSFPVPGTLMIEPTESEALEELDRFCDAMIHIKKEIEEIISGNSGLSDNVLKNAPHTLLEVTANKWNHDYSREQAAYPLAWLKERKTWPSVARVNDSYGDRNLICSCPSVEAYRMEEKKEIMA